MFDNIAINTTINSRGHSNLRKNNGLQRRKRFFIITIPIETLLERSIAFLVLFRFIKKPHYLFVSSLIGQHK